MRRTIGDARRVFEDSVATQVNDPQRRKLAALLEEAEEMARQRADEFTAEREKEILAAREEALRELTECRDGYDDLFTRGGSGRISAAEYARGLDNLVIRQAQAEGVLATAEDQVAAIEEIEADPVAWFDELTTRVPRLQGEWPW